MSQYCVLPKSHMQAYTLDIINRSSIRYSKMHVGIILCILINRHGRDWFASLCSWSYMQREFESCVELFVLLDIDNGIHEWVRKTYALGWYFQCLHTRGMVPEQIFYGKETFQESSRGRKRPVSQGWNEHGYSEARVCLGVKLSGYSEANHAKHRSTLGKPGHTVSKCIFTHIHGLHQLSKYSHFNRNTFWSWCNGSHLCNPCSSERPRWMCVGDIKEFV